MAVAQRTGRLNSGDVSLFYRLFGSPGATPIIILHGSNYYDSYDWINVATALASDREVIVHDKRGWGESTWSPSKDYSYDAFLDDALAVIGMMNLAKINNPPRFGFDRERAVNALIKLDNGYMLKRDPDNSNRQPIGEGAKLPRRPVREMWAELAMVKVPILLVRGLQSNRYPPGTVERMTKEYPHIQQVPVESQHDVARMAPDALIAAVKKFIGAA